MPAVTVDNVLALPRIDRPVAPASATERPVVSVTSAPSGFEGEGFPVRRAFAGVDLALLDPFIHMDQMGEVEYGPGEPKGTSWHPHRGFETATYIIDGTFEHQDNAGGGGVITNGDTQWMTAGAGIQHIERPPEALVMSGGTFHGIQLWVNLPKAKKWEAPRYQDIRAGPGHPPHHPRRRGAGAGDRGRRRRPHRSGRHPHADGLRPRHPQPGGRAGAARGSPTSTPSSTPWPARAPSGSGRRPFRMGQLAVFGKGDFVTVAANERQESRTPNLDVIVLGGRPIREPIAWYGPFVMNTREEVIQAMDDFHAGRLGTIPASSLQA